MGPLRPGYTGSFRNPTVQGSNLREGISCLRISKRFENYALRPHQRNRSALVAFRTSFRCDDWSPGCPRACTPCPQLHRRTATRSRFADGAFVFRRVIDSDSRWTEIHKQPPLRVQPVSCDIFISITSPFSCFHLL